MTARAAYYTGNRGFSIERVDPASPGPDEVQIDVAFCGICGTDLHVYLGHMDARIGDRRVIGHEMSGRIAALGTSVDGFTIGQPVVVRPLDPCGHCPACRHGHDHICHKLVFIGLDRDGAFQDKWNVPAKTVHRLPDELPLQTAALVEPMAVACHAVSRAGLSGGEDTLVIGGGPIGTLVGMAARYAGSKVTIAEINPNRLAFAEKLGFDTIDPATQNAIAMIDEATGGKGADIVFEVSGSAAGAELMTAVASTRGKVVMVAIHAENPRVDLFRFFWREIEMIGARVYEPVDYERAIELVAAGTFGVENLVTAIRPLDEIATAFSELADNPAAMKTLIRLN